ncbi:DUF2490 domain-containing protein [Methylicorpusculum sp.]|uniref:DUF2490 domain-containing protein n=1 Tax=Methylicorpusculum sp. TaxID=2713644 RepID=UPI0027164185|nr:DUF2490 domain-containing protein [Methylicorpusculum sp.]MDO8845027.1 DUF2490 domain-containing protein [Methylicorpusculum sp.]
MKKISALVLSLLFSSAVCADSNDDSSIWLSNTYQTDFGGSHYLAFLELAPRSKNDNNDFSQLLIRPIVGYKLTEELQLWLGYTWHGEYNDSSSIKFDNATHDVMQQLQWIHNLTPELNFQYRLRFEERFFVDADVAYRVRHRFRFVYSIPDTKAYLIALDELFVYFNSLNYSARETSVQPGINQNRSYAGVGYKLTPQINIDTGYQLQYVNNFGAPDVYNHVWFTNLNFTF